jgi:hypothetical protein
VDGRGRREAWARRRALVQQPSPQARAYNHAGESARDSRLVELERKVGQQTVELDFFKEALRHVKAPPPPNGRAWRQRVFALIQAMTPPQGVLSIERMCALAGVSRATITGTGGGSLLTVNRPNCVMCSSASRWFTATTATVDSTRFCGARAGR